MRLMLIQGGKAIHPAQVANLWRGRWFVRQVLNLLGRVRFSDALPFERYPMQEECLRVQSKRRGWRRHHRKRIIRKWRRVADHWWIGEKDKDTWALKVYGMGSIRCGCMMCKSPRRGGLGDSPLTIQERKALEDAKDQLSKEYEYHNGCVLDTAYYNIGCECFDCRPELYHQSRKV